MAHTDTSTTLAADRCSICRVLQLCNCDEFQKLTVSGISDDKPHMQLKMACAITDAIASFTHLLNKEALASLIAYDSD